MYTAAIRFLNTHYSFGKVVCMTMINSTITSICVLPVVSVEREGTSLPAGVARVRISGSYQNICDFYALRGTFIVLFYFLYFKVKAITPLISEWFGKRVNNRYRVSI